MAGLTSLGIEHDYRGLALPREQHAAVRFGLDAHELIVEVDAPYFGDPAPAGPAGPTERLWEYEVCELFIADAGEHYLEIELSPHGQHLVLELQGVRNAVRTRLPIAYSASIEVAAQAQGQVRGRYRGSARVPAAYLPARPTRANAYLIHGSGADRAYHAHSPPQGTAPDFHRLECFVPFRWAADAL